MESMFDIYTIQGDGTALLVETVECRAMAQETAYHLSVLFPGESFVYFDRAEDFSAMAKLMQHPYAQSPLPC